MRAEAGEQQLKTRNEEHEQENQDAQRQHQQDGRIKHCRHHLAAHFLFARLEVRDLVEHDVEESPRLARLDHRHVNLRKRFR